MHCRSRQTAKLTGARCLHLMILDHSKAVILSRRALRLKSCFRDFGRKCLELRVSACATTFSRSEDIRCWRRASSRVCVKAWEWSCPCVACLRRQRLEIWPDMLKQLYVIEQVN